MLPKLKYPMYDLTISSNKKVEKFRPFLVKEEKLLLMAKTSNDPVEYFRAIKQVVNNCAINDKFDVDVLPIFDLEYLFLRIRAFSVNNVVNLSYRDNDDNQVYNFEVDLNTIEVKFPEGVDKNIRVSDSVTITMKYPITSILDDNQFLKSGDESFFELIVRCIDKIVDGDDIYDPKNYTKEEIESFLDQLGVTTYQNIVKFMESTPKLFHKLEYKNANGKDRVIELTTLSDFFTLV